MAIFPITDLVTTSTTILEDRGLNFLFDFHANEFVEKDGKIVELFGDAAVAFWIEKTLKTQLESSRVYENTGFGTDFESVQGKIFPREIEKVIAKNIIVSALLKHERIATIENFQFEHELDKVAISFEVVLRELTEVEQINYSSEEDYIRISSLEDIKKFLGVKLLTSNRFYFKTNLGNQVFLRLVAKS